MGFEGVLVLVLLALCSSWIQAESTDAAVIGVSDVVISVLDRDTVSPDFKTTLKFEERKSVELSANHLQKLKFSFKLTTPEGGSFSAHQVFLKLKNDNHEKLFLVKSTRAGYELVLDFLGLAEDLHYLSGQYSLDLIVGDSKMANSFSWNLGNLELELPEDPKGETTASAATVDLSARYGPKPEISHIFRVPEKRPPTAVSYIFLALTLLPFLGFLIGLKVLKINLGNLPSSGLSRYFPLAFHGVLLAILGLYALFWLKFDLFYTLRLLGFLGIFACVTGYKLLSHLADGSSKVKVA